MTLKNYAKFFVILTAYYFPTPFNHDMNVAPSFKLKHCLFSFRCSWFGVQIQQYLLAFQNIRRHLVNLAKIQLDFA